MQKGSQTKAGWRLPEWCADVGCRRSTAYGLLTDGKIKSVKLGNSRIITTSPAEFLATLADPVMVREAVKPPQPTPSPAQPAGAQTSRRRAPSAAR
jgi:hypothetical protein